MPSLKIRILVSLIAAFFTGSAQAALNTPEATLLTQATIIAGQNHTDAQRQALMGKIIAQYDQTAPQAGREDRLVQALEEMNIMTPARAEDFRATVDQVVESQVAAHPTQDGSALFAGALASVLKNSDVGAQYTNCQRDNTMAVASAVGLTASIIAYTHFDGSIYQESAAMGVLVFGSAAVWFMIEGGNDCN